MLLFARFSARLMVGYVIVITGSERRSSAALVAALSANDFDRGDQVGEVDSDPIGEASGLVASRRNPGVLWTHNDSGGSNRVFAIDSQGRYLGAFALEGAVAGDCKSFRCVDGALDYEDIAVGPGPNSGDSYLYVGDIGSGRGTRKTIEVHRVIEPEIDAEGRKDQSDALSNVDTITLEYPGQFQDSETLMVDPWNGDIYIVTKDRDEKNRVYRAVAPHALDETVVLEFMGKMGWEEAVGGDILFNGLEVIMKKKKTVYIYSRSEGMELWEAIVTPAEGISLRYREEPQGESVAFASNGTGYYTLSESVGARTVPLYFYKRDGTLPVLEEPKGIPASEALSDKPTEVQRNVPTTSPSAMPSSPPSRSISDHPSDFPTSEPTNEPSYRASNNPSMQPSTLPTLLDTFMPSIAPTFTPSESPTSQPSDFPTSQPTVSSAVRSSAAPSIELGEDLNVESANALSNSGKQTMWDSWHVAILGILLWYLKV